jgi:hypothetical protein
MADFILMHLLMMDFKVIGGFMFELMMECNTVLFDYCHYIWPTYGIRKTGIRINGTYSMLDYNLACLLHELFDGNGVTYMRHILGHVEIL